MRSCAVLLILIALVACDTKRQSAEEFTRKAAVNALEKVVERERKAIRLAKEAHSRIGGFLYFREPERNEDQVRSLMTNLKGDIGVVGWRTRYFDDDTYLVYYAYTEQGDPTDEKGWAFEVKLRSELVRSVNGDTELERKYGVNQPK